MKHVVACLVLATLALGFVGLAVSAQEAARFSDPERVAAFLDARPRVAVSLLESMLSQEALTALETAMFPAPTNEERRKMYEAARTVLRRTGLGPEDPAVAELTRKLAALPTPVEPEKL